MVEMSEALSAIKCTIKVETDDGSASFEGKLFMSSFGFTWQLEETMEEFDFRVRDFLVFAKQNGEAIYCQLDR